MLVADRAARQRCDVTRPAAESAAAGCIDLEHEIVVVFNSRLEYFDVYLRGMNVQAVEPNVEAAGLLAGAQFIDAYSIATDDAAVDARHAAEKMLERPPRWTLTLLALRDLFVAPFGLKTAATARRASTNRIGMFPVLSETPRRIVAGLNDSHLDFRLVVDVSGSGAGGRVTATTVVLTHNLLGRVYLAIILPFHRLIVRSMLRRIAR
jgi:hypothetical protein